MSESPDLMAAWSDLDSSGDEESAVEATPPPPAPVPFEYDVDSSQSTTGSGEAAEQEDPPSSTVAETAPERLPEAPTPAQSEGCADSGTAAETSSEQAPANDLHAGREAPKAPAAAGDSLPSTGSGKADKVREQALAKAESMLVDNADGMMPSAPEPVPVAATTAGGSLFSTGSGKAVKISKQALAKAKDMLVDDTGGKLYIAAAPAPTVAAAATTGGSRFSTGGGKAVKISEQALTKAKGLLEDGAESKALAAPKRPSSTAATAGGSLFSTGNGKTIEISDQALAKAESMLEEDADGKPPVATASPPPIAAAASTGGSLFSTGSGKAVKISKQALAKAKGVLEDGTECKAMAAPEPPSTTATAAGGSLFSTGSGKAVKISKQALAKAKDMLVDDTGGKLSIAAASAPTVAAAATTTGGSLFSTGGGKAVKISEQALNKAKGMLEEDTDGKPPIAAGIASDSLFSTGAGKAVRISQQALSKAKGMLAEEKKQEEKGAGPVAPQGAPLFSTGAGKSVTISQEALVKAKSMLIDEDDMAPATTGGSLFSSGAGKAVKISEQALSRAKSMLVDEEQIVSKAKSPVSQVGTPSVLSAADDCGAQQTLRTPLARVRRTGAMSTPARAAPRYGNKRRLPHSDVRPTKRRGFVTPFKDSAARQALQRGTPDQRRNRSTTPHKPTHKQRQPLEQGTQEPPLLPEGRASLQLVLGGEMRQRPRAERVVKRAISHGVARWAFQVKYANAVLVTFDPSTLLAQGLGGAGLGWRDIALRLRESGRELASDQWVANHFRWVVLKLAAYTRLFPHVRLFEGCLSFGNVQQQLEYRYDREVRRAQRPILRKVIETDAPSTAHMVLFLARGPVDGAVVVVSDGWYGVEAVADAALLQLIRDGRLPVGGKLRVCGARLQNGGVGVLETACNNLVDNAADGTPQPQLALSRNCTKPVAWDTRLGIQRERAFAKRLSQVARSEGSTVPLLICVLARRVALEMCEKDGGRWVARTPDEEAAEQARYEDAACKAREAVQAELEATWQEPSSQDDAEAIMEARRAQLEARLAERVPATRQVKARLQLLLQQPFEQHFAHLTVWGPSPDLLAAREGALLHLHGAQVGRGSRSSSILRLRGGKALVQAREYNPASYEPRSYVPLAAVAEARACPVVDTVGLVVHTNDDFLFLAPAIEQRGPHGTSAVISVERRGSAKVPVGALVAMRDLERQRVEPYTGFIACASDGEICSSLQRLRQQAGWAHLVEPWLAQQLPEEDTRRRVEEAQAYVRRQMGAHHPPAVVKQAEGVVATPERSGQSSLRSREERLKLQRLKKEQWRRRHELLGKENEGNKENENGGKKRNDGKWTATRPCELKVPSALLVQIMLGRKTVDVRRRGGVEEQLRSPDVVRFSDGHQHQLTRVQTCVGYDTPDLALAHESLAAADPVAADESEALAKMAARGLQGPVLALRFEPMDTMPGQT